MTRRNNSFAIFTATGRILAMIAGFLMPILLTRFLTQENYGLYSQYNTLVTFISSVFSFGIQSNLYYFSHRCNESQKTLIGNTLFMLIMSALLAVLLLLIPQTAKFFIGEGNLEEYKSLICVGVFFSIPVLLIFPLFVTRGDKTLSVIYPPVETLVRILIVIGTVMIFDTIESILFAMVSYHILQFVFTLFYSLRSYRNTKEKWFCKKLLKSQFTYVAPFGFAVVLNTLLRQFDKMMCISFITPLEYAIYSLAFYGVPGINQIYESVAEVNILNMSAAYKDNNLKETISLAQSYVIRLMSFSVPLIFVISVFAKIIIGFFFPAEYLASVPFFRIYLFTFLFGAIGAGLVLRATGKTKYTLQANLISTIVYLPFAYFSIKYYGIWGAITTAMLGSLLPKIFQIFFEIKILKISFWNYLPWKKIGKILFISVFLIIPVVIVNHFIHLNVFTAGFIGIVYVLIVWLIELQLDLFIISKDKLQSYLLKILKKRK